VATLKRFLQDFRLRPEDRSALAFSDTTKIRMYGDPKRPGIRLKATGNVPAQQMEFPVDTPQWLEKTPTTPPVRQRSASAYDVSRKELVLFGGLGASSRIADTWTYNGVTYTSKSPGTSPTARDNHSMAYDIKRDAVVMFGGNTSGGLSSETWEWDGTTWALQSPSTVPAAREGHAVVFDPLREKILMFGGLTGSGASAETWEYDGADWTLLTTGPIDLARHAMGSAFDSIRGLLYVFGGINFSSVTVGDLWQFHSVKGWTKVLPVTSPVARSQLVMWYDPLLRRVYLFGGLAADGTTELGDTWEFDGTKWTQFAAGTDPTVRFEATASYMDHIQRAVIFGGEDDGANQLNDHWEYVPSVGNTVELKRWSPQAVKQWQAFEEVSTKPDGTAIFWQLKNATQALYYNGVTWAAATAFDWNTEDEIADNMTTFPIADKTVRPVVRLLTADRFATPVLTEHKFMIGGVFNSWEDFLDSVVTALENTSFFSSTGKIPDSATTTFNLLTDQLWKADESLTITGVDAVYDHTADPSHDIDLLSSYDANTGLVTLSSAVPAGNGIWVERVVFPEIIVNYRNAEYIEVAKTPALIVDTIQATGTDDTTIKRDLAHKSQSQGHRMADPVLHREILLTMSLHTSKIQDWTRLTSNVQALPRKLGGVLTSNALDVEWSITLTKRLLTYNPKAQFSDLKTAAYELCVKDVHMWVDDVQDLPIVGQFNPTLRRKEVVGPFVDSGPTIPSSGQIANIQPRPVIETG
jgi:hypothetical protein